METNEKGVTVYKSKYGYHACSFETFLKLKALKKAYWKAVRGLAEWFRWNAKQPQNRVLKRKVIDEKGQIVGKEVIGSWTEPNFCKLFGEPTCKKGYMTVPEHLNDDVILAYEQARMPQEKDMVKNLCLTDEEINNLFEKLSN